MLIKILNYLFLIYYLIEIVAINLEIINNDQGIEEIF